MLFYSILQFTLFFILFPSSSKCRDLKRFGTQVSACPRECEISGANPNNWTTYFDSRISNLISCNNRPKLLNYLVNFPLNDTNINHAIQACSTFRAANLTDKIQQALPSNGDVDLRCKIENGQSVNLTGTVQTNENIQIAWKEASYKATPGQIVTASGEIQYALLDSESGSNSSATGTNFFHVHYGDTVVSVYAGKKILKLGLVLDTIQNFTDQIASGKLQVGETTVLQLCGSGRPSDFVFGLIADTTSGLSAISRTQQAVKLWSQAQCVTDLPNTDSFGNSSIWYSDTSGLLTQISSNSTQNTTSSSPPIWQNSTNWNDTSHTTHQLADSGACSTTQVVSGDGCASLASRCGITGAQLSQYNPDSSFCMTLQPGQHVCCSSGTLPDFAPKPNADGTCATYLVKSGEFCATIAAANSLTVAQLESFNKNTWAWGGCNALLAGENICLSTGDPPMPAPLENAVCGPQVPGTIKPPSGTNISELNPCPLKACW